MKSIHHTIIPENWLPKKYEDTWKLRYEGWLSYIKSQNYKYRWDKKEKP